ncbi:MAG: glutamate--tRNA ligase [candidate division WOR-3 bacterium]|nr:glutamate--tRNA ligase [candidate division WOR-3 bacterium]
MKQDIRVRIAPSPTGFFHIGSARTALYNWLFARHHNGKFILRIEDTDATRSSKEMVEVILTSLNWLGLDWDEGPQKGGEYGPYFQSERKEIYREYAEKLIKEEKAYWCFCTEEEIEKERQYYLNKKMDWKHRCREKFTETEKQKRMNAGMKPALRFKVPVEKRISFSDIVHGVVEKNASDIEDFVIIKSDGMPTYNFACVVDDFLMKISHVIRGVEHIANTPKQIMLYEAFNLPIPFFAHLPVILGKDKKKLSKRLGARSVLEYRDEGYLPDALINFLALLGWSPGGDEEIMDRERIIELFTLERINPANAIYDETKLEWLNNHYIINRIDEKTFLTSIEPFVISSGYITEEEYKKNREWVDRVCLLMRPRLKVLKDISRAKYFFTDDFEYDENSLKKYLNDKSVSLTREFMVVLKELKDFNAHNIEDSLRKFCEQKAIKTRELIHPLRVYITGTEAGPGLFETMELIGRARCIKRVLNIIERYEHGTS